MPSCIFVFGSNRQGRHGAGAAYTAKQKYGAIYGQSEGLQGNSYAIITKELREDYPPVCYSEIEAGVNRFIQFAEAHPELCFEVTRIGCGLAGFKDQHIAYLFRHATSNCKLHRVWNEILEVGGGCRLKEEVPKTFQPLSEQQVEENRLQHGLVWF
jgi:hypothetical protein